MHTEATKEYQKNISINSTKVKLQEHTTFRQFPPSQSENKIAKTKYEYNGLVNGKHSWNFFLFTNADEDYENVVPFMALNFHFNTISMNSRTKRQCSWKNYQFFNNFMQGDPKIQFLKKFKNTEWFLEIHGQVVFLKKNIVSLSAHSWILMNYLPNVREELNRLFIVLLH